MTVCRRKHEEGKKCQGHSSVDTKVLGRRQTRGGGEESERLLLLGTADTGAHVQAQLGIKLVGSYLAT